MRTPLIDRIMSQEASSPPQGNRSLAYRKALEDFFQYRSEDSRLKYYLRFRNFAQFRRVPRTSWPAALERFFCETSKSEAEEVYEQFRSWLKVRIPYCIKPMGNWGMGMENISRHFRAQGLITWQFDHRYSNKVKLAWASCDPAFRKKAEEYLHFLEAKDHSRGTVKDAGTSLRALGNASSCAMALTTSTVVLIVSIPSPPDGLGPLGLPGAETLNPFVGKHLGMTIGHMTARLRRNIKAIRR